MNQLRTGFEENSRVTRRGAAFLMLVVVVVLVVLAALRTVVHSEFSSRRSETERQRVETMIRAIMSAESSQTDWSGTIELPISEETNERIELSHSEDQLVVTANWFRGETVLDSMTRKRTPHPEQQE